MVIMVTFVLGANPIVALANETETDAYVHQVEAQQTTTKVSASVRLNNQNWFTSVHPVPETFIVTPDGEVFGTTTNGIPFYQTNVPNDADVRVQKFEIQDHYHFIVEGREVYTEEELATTIAQIQLERSTKFWKSFVEAVRW